MKKKMKKILPLLLGLVLLFGFTMTANAAGNVVYTNGVEFTNWPHDRARLETLTLSGAEVKRYEWVGDTCNVQFVTGTPSDAEIMFAVTNAGNFANSMQVKLNGTAISSTGTVRLSDGKLENISLYVKGFTNKGTKYFNLSIAEENNLPTLADPENLGTAVEVTGTEGYNINLASIFTDADATDTLSYLVSVNDAEPVAAEVDENGVYHYPTQVAGEYVLVFTAKDSKGDISTDTYTATVNVKNSEVTYQMSVFVPQDLTVSFYANAGFDSTGSPVNGDALAYLVEDGNYVLVIPENVEIINVITDELGGIALESSKEKSVIMRKVHVTAADMFGAAVQGTVKVSYLENAVNYGKDNTFLLETKQEYTFTSTPSDTTNYKTGTSSTEIESGEGTLEILSKVDFENLKTITTPTGAVAQLFTYNQYYSNTEMTCRGTEVKDDGTSVHYFSGVKTAAPANILIYRVTYKDYIVKAGWTTSSNIKISYNESDLKSNTRVDYSQATDVASTFADDSVLLNVNSQNYLSMSVGDTKTLKAYRAWEIIPVSYNNWIIEPDFHFNVVYESEEGVISLADKSNNMTGGESWKTLRANKEGFAIIEVTYDAIDVRGQSFDGAYGASDPDRTGLMVVQVGGSSAAVDFGIECLASQGSVIYENSTPKAWDAEFDTLYFTGESGELQLSPSVSSGTVTGVEVSNDKGHSWTVLTAVEGVYNANIVPGNNILKVTTDSGVSYQVVRGDQISYTVEELAASDSNTNNNNGIIEAGETVRIKIDGLHSPIPKMAGNYNPGYGGNTDGYSSHHISYMFNDSRIQGAGSQYDWNTTTNYIDITLPETGGTYTLEDGYIGVGVIGLDNFVNGGDSHRNIPDGGCATRGSKTTFHTRSVLPEITISVKSNCLAGDVSGDETINATDASLILRYVAGNIEDITVDAADVNKDGVVNATDASLVLRYAAGLISEFPTVVGN